MRELGILCLALLLTSCATETKQKRIVERQGAGEGSRVILDDEPVTPLNDDGDLGTDFDQFDETELEEDEENAECYRGDPFICEIEAAIVRQTNELRAPAAPMTGSAKIGYVSRMWSESMQNVGFISHFGFPSSRNADYHDEFGSRASMMAENVAMTYSNGQDAESIAREFTTMWWNSSGHRRNMMGNYPMIGVGVARSGNSYYATQIFGRE